MMSLPAVEMTLATFGTTFGFPKSLPSRLFCKACKSRITFGAKVFKKVLPLLLRCFRLPAFMIISHFDIRKKPIANAVATLFALSVHSAAMLRVKTRLYTFNARCTLGGPCISSVSARHSRPNRSNTGSFWASTATANNFKKRPLLSRFHLAADFKDLGRAFMSNGATGPALDSLHERSREWKKA